jgi:hypothetical protein
MSDRTRRATRPTSCLFGAPLELRADCDRNTRRGLRVLRSCPYGSLERAVGKVLRSGGGDADTVAGAAKSQQDPSGKQRRRVRPDDEPMTAFGGALDSRKDSAFDLADRTN